MRRRPRASPPASFDGLLAGEPPRWPAADTARRGRRRCREVADLDAAAAAPVPVLGITGTGGSGKSSLTDELVRRFRLDQEDKLRIAVLAVDPTRRRGGGALLGDRIRMNALDGRACSSARWPPAGATAKLPEHLGDVDRVLKAAGFDLVIVETPGIGQGDAGIVPFVDRSLYVMTPEFGAASQLEKIDMLDFADVVAINKFERRGAEDALRDVGRQLVRNREAFGASWEDMPVFGTSAATFNDDGVTALYQHLRGLLAETGLPVGEGRCRGRRRKTSTGIAAVVPPHAGALPGRDRRDRPRLPRRDRGAGRAARRRQHLRTAEAARRAPAGRRAGRRAARGRGPCRPTWPRRCWTAGRAVVEYSGDELVVTVRDKEIHTR